VEASCGSREGGVSTTAPVTLSERDLLALLGIVTDHRGDDPGDGLPLSLLRWLMAQVPSEAVSFFGLDRHWQTAWFGQGIPDDDGDMDAFWFGTPSRSCLAVHASPRIGHSAPGIWDVGSLIEGPCSWS
jgi:hypothetical protein